MTTEQLKIVKGTVTIDGILYKAFEMWNNGPWKVVKGSRCTDPSVFTHIRVKSAKGAIQRWLAQRIEK